jgi:ferredoxin-NADP reductase
MARAAVSRRLTWQVATVREVRDETATARTLGLDVPGWPGHVAGQHVTVRLTAADGYAAHRDYSVASAPQAGRLELTVQRLEDGEVSPYLTGIAEPGDQFEIRGPIGGWFGWPPGDQRRLLLLAGGSGVVPLMSMIRAHAQAKSEVPVRLIYSARTPADVIYAAELSQREAVSPLSVTYLYTRTAPPGTTSTGRPVLGVRDGLFHGLAGRFHGAADLDAPPAEPARVGPATAAYSGRLTAGVLFAQAFPAKASPAIFVCGPNGFVETAADLLVAAGHEPGTIKTERFGATG